MTGLGIKFCTNPFYPCGAAEASRFACKLIIDQNALTDGFVYKRRPLREQQEQVSNWSVRRQRQSRSGGLHQTGRKTPLRKRSLRLIPNWLLSLISTWYEEREEYQRFWYMLPPLVKRHIPDFCLSRVNHGTTCLYALESRGLLMQFCHPLARWTNPRV